VTQAPLFETNVIPGGIEAETETPVAFDGPALVTFTVKVTFVAGGTVDGPVTETERSVLMTVVDCEAVLFAEDGSLALFGVTVPDNVTGPGAGAVMFSVML